MTVLFGLSCVIAVYTPDRDRGKEPKIVIVTTAYHVFRALLLARQLGIPCVGFGSGTKWYFSLNAFLREFAGYLRLRWKLHAVVSVVAAVLAAGFL